MFQEFLDIGYIGGLGTCAKLPRDQWLEAISDWIRLLSYVCEWFFFPGMDGMTTMAYFVEYVVHIGRCWIAAGNLRRRAGRSVEGSHRGRPAHSQLPRLARCHAVALEQQHDTDGRTESKKVFDREQECRCRPILKQPVG